MVAVARRCWIHRVRVFRTTHPEFYCYNWQENLPGQRENVAGLWVHSVYHICAAIGAKVMSWRWPAVLVAKPAHGMARCVGRGLQHVLIVAF